MTRFLFCLLMVTLLASACDEKDDVALIEDVCEEIVVSAEKHDISGMMEHATDRFRGYPGARNEQDVRQLLFVAFRRYGEFDVVHPRFKVRLEPDAKAASVSVPFTIVREGESLDRAGLDELVASPDQWVDAVSEAVGDPYYLDMKFVKTGDDWKVRRADITGSQRVAP